MQELTIITCCPKCKTQFKVTQGQLKIANNAVRCGSCLAVFSATEQRLPAVRPAPTPTKKTQSNTEQQPLEQKKKPVPASPLSSPAPKHTTDIEEKVLQEDTANETLITADTIPTLSVEKEPVILEVKETKNSHINYTWLTACFLALCLLVGQQLWFKRASLYWDPALNPLYKKICTQLNCPDFFQQDVSKLENLQLVIREHDIYEGAASVSLLLQNRAHYPQPYPALKLTFKDLKGRTVSSRIFQPNEYIDINSIDLLAMPPNTPIQAQLDIMTPGNRGVSYELELLAPHL